MGAQNAQAAGRPRLWTKDFTLVIIINFLIFLNHVMILSTFPLFITELGGSTTIAGVAAFFFSFVAVVLRPFVGWFLNNGKRRIVLGIGLIGLAVIPLGYLATSVLVVAIIARMAQGAFMACSNTTSSTIATDIIPKPRFAEGMGMFGMSTSLAMACAPALGLALIEQISFDAMFAVATGTIVLAIILFLILRNPKIEVEPQKLSFKTLLNRNALPASAVALFCLLTMGALENFIAKFANDIGLPSGGLYFVIVAITMLVTRMTVGKLADIKGEAIFVYSCNACMFIALCLLAFVPNLFTFILSAILAGYGFGGQEPALQAMAVRIAPPEERGSANSTFLCAYDIGMGLGGFFAGVLISAVGYNWMFFIIAFSSVVSVLLYLFWGRNHASAFKNCKSKIA